MKRAFWTPEQDAELQALFATMSSREVAKKLGRSLCAVENRIRRLRGEVSPARNEAESFNGSPQAEAAEAPARGVPDVQAVEGRARQEREGAEDRAQPGTARAPEATGRGVAPAVHTRASNYLVISDLQIPYHAPSALDFCKRVRREFSVPLENVLCVGDEFDLYAFSHYDKSPDAPHTPSQEIAACRAEIARWAAAFPQMRICRSNHGGRLAKAAARGGLPREVIAPYREILGVPEGWRYADHWIVDATRERFRVEHGHRKPGGHSGLRTRPLFRGMSTAWGHEHAEAATLHMETGEKSVWALRVGSLITREPVPAFDYSSDDASRAVGSVGVVLDGGRLPLVVKM